MKFTPKTEREIAEEGLIPSGTVCDFEVLEAEDTTSKAGNDMIALKLRVWRPNGSTTMMRDWLLPNFPAKLLAFAKATGMEDAYHAGAFSADDLIGKAGKLKVTVENSDQYGAQNRPGFYVAAGKAEQPASRSAQPAQQRPQPKGLDDDSEIPF